MFNSLTGLGFCVLTALIIILADLSLKVAADTGARVLSAPMVLGCGLYLISALLWFLAMRHIPLGQATVVYSMFSLVGLFVVGAFFFDESIEWRDLAGLALAVIAMALMLRVI